MTFDFATRIRSDAFYESPEGRVRRRVLMDAFEQDPAHVSRQIHAAMVGTGFAASAGLEALSDGSPVRYRLPGLGPVEVVVHPLAGAHRDFVVRSQVELILPPSSFTAEQRQTCPTPDGFEAAEKAGSA